ncbi:Deoxycytidine monophosphate (dCMP) deaminase [Lunasporangiospora selenospora]|uniref:Deoxycytidylate deaminase n=1 Tax=Lunasporangiospora selenospora TaxID=979761 RepID=A0A9P6FWC9_9FUNG|nr:Deoxycytidine monophosphate (dCMP) deaminase [Lunasporangiospora selenospora]
MFVGVVGPPCSGKHEVANLLRTLYGFQRLSLNPKVGLQVNGKPGQVTNEPKDQESRSSLRSSNHDLTTEADLAFDTIEEMLDHVTRHWMKHYVTCDLNTVEGIAFCRKRPFFLQLSVESPMMIRYRRNVARSMKLGMAAPTLEEFVLLSDLMLYSSPSKHNDSLGNTIPSPSLSTLTGPSSPLACTDESDKSIASDNSQEASDLEVDQILVRPVEPTPLQILPHYDPPYKLLSMADLAILNDSSDLSVLQESLVALNITNPDLLRPGWDSYFMFMADLAARRSNCMKRRVGCVLVRDKRVIATGYNGTPKNMPNCNDGGCNRCNAATPCGKGLDRCLCMHAEENALLEAGRERVGTGSTIYCNTCPCLGCAIKIVQVGVSQVIYSESYGMDDLTAEVFRKAGVVLRQHATPDLGQWKP